MAPVPLRGRRVRRDRRQPQLRVRRSRLRLHERLRPRVATARDRDRALLPHDPSELDRRLPRLRLPARGRGVQVSVDVHRAPDGRPTLRQLARPIRRLPGRQLRRTAGQRCLEAGPTPLGEGLAVAHWALIGYLAAMYLQPQTKFPALASLRPMAVLGALALAACGAYVARRGRGVVFEGLIRSVAVFYGFMTASVLTAYIHTLAYDRWVDFGKMLLALFFLVNVFDTLAKIRTLVYSL